MPRQETAIRAPQTRQALDALIEVRNEMQAQLRTLEDRRFQLAEQVPRIDAQSRAEVQRRIKTLDGSIDRLERQIATANEYITAGHARFGGQAEVTVAVTPVPAVPPLPPELPVPPVEQVIHVPPPGGLSGNVERALILEGIGFLLLGAMAWVWISRRFDRKLAARSAGGDPAQMAQLQQSVDAIALEVERISENQRWVTKVLHEKAIGTGAASPVNVGAAEQVPAPRKP